MSQRNSSLGIEEETSLQRRADILRLEILNYSFIEMMGARTGVKYFAKVEDIFVRHRVEFNQPKAPFRFCKVVSAIDSFKQECSTGIGDGIDIRTTIAEAYPQAPTCSEFQFELVDQPVDERSSSIPSG